jgi:hypothetical protein
MQFKDATHKILQEADKPLHYNEITDIALRKGILDTAGLTPHLFMLLACVLDRAFKGEL